ncbi:MAG: hypothetical protein IH845_03030 [Nanoarchaeota archaeon]|nr:hypothetical protein [Nanoarchaeota archaeon]
MAGFLTHMSIFFGSILLGYLFWNWKYGLSFGIGHLAPDLLDFGVIGIIEASLKPTIIIRNQLFRPLMIFGHTFTNSIILAAVLLAIVFILFKLKKISKEKATIAAIIIIMFTLGILSHIIADELIIETNHWI